MTQPNVNDAMLSDASDCTRAPITAKELAERMTKVFRLLDDLPFADTCTVIDAVLSAKLKTCFNIDVPDSCTANHWPTDNRD